MRQPTERGEGKKEFKEGYQKLNHVSLFSKKRKIYQAEGEIRQKV